jgi:hypothetical protein
VIGLYLARATARVIPFAAVGLFLGFLAYVAATAQNTNQIAANLIIGLLAFFAVLIFVLGAIFALQRPKHWQGLTRDAFRRQRELIRTGKRLRSQQDRSTVVAQDDDMQGSDVVVTQIDQVHEIGIVDQVTLQNILRDFWLFVRGHTPSQTEMSFGYSRISDDLSITRPGNRFYLISWFGGATVKRGIGGHVPATTADYDWLSEQLQPSLDPPGL